MQMGILIGMDNWAVDLFLWCMTALLQKDASSAMFTPWEINEMLKNDWFEVDFKKKIIIGSLTVAQYFE